MTELNALDREIENQAQLGQSFSLAAMIGREGANLLNSEDAIPKNLQILNQMDPLWQSQLKDVDGALQTEFAAFLKDYSETQSELWCNPSALLSQCVAFLLVPENLENFVRKVDSRWGKMFDERPIFEPPLASQNANYKSNTQDPYTLESVRKALEKMLS